MKCTEKRTWWQCLFADIDHCYHKKTITRTDEDCVAKKKKVHTYEILECCRCSNKKPVFEDMVF